MSKILANFAIPVSCKFDYGHQLLETILTYSSFTMKRNGKHEVYINHSINYHLNYILNKKILENKTNYKGGVKIQNGNIFHKTN